MKKLMKNKKVMFIIAVVMLVMALLPSGVIANPPMGSGDPSVASAINYQGQLTDDAGNAVVAGNSIEDCSANVEASLSTSYTLDQAQEGTNYSFWFEKTVIRWQEFKPTQTSLARIDLYIHKNGVNPGNLRISVKDQVEDVLWENTVFWGDIGTMGWIEVPVVPSISLEPDDSYYIYVWSDGDSPSIDQRYFWGGQTNSVYDRGISSVESGWPGYDFAFRTWSSLPCVDFEDLKLGPEYYVGDTFPDSGVYIEVQSFQWSNGQWTSAGQAWVGNAGLAGGSGQDMVANNVNLAFDFGGPCTGLSLLFSEYVGNLNIKVNGDFKNFNDFSDINGTTIGNVTVVVNEFGDCCRGSLTLSGIINSFAVGGQELWIDNVCPTAPVTWNLPWGLDADPTAINIYTYQGIAVTLAVVDATMPDGLLIWYYGGPGVGYKFYKKGWGAYNTLTALVPNAGVFGIVPTASVWYIPQS